VIIEALHEEHSIFHMGGLRKDLPIAFWTVLIAGCSLAGLPFITAGFYSKDLIIWGAWSAEQGHPGFWIVGIIGALLTSLYTFRLIFRVFFGPIQTPVSMRPGHAMTVPLVVLAFFAVVGGMVKEPLLAFVQSTLPAMVEANAVGMTETFSELVAALAFLAGLYVAHLFHLRKRSLADDAVANPAGRVFHAWWSADWGFDWLYDRVFVQPFLWAARINKNDFIDALYTGIACLTEAMYRALRLSQTGLVRWYAAGIAVGSVLFFAMAVFS
jgi:NADH-quinone oxidoreductase subunit L